VILGLPDPARLKRGLDVAATLPARALATAKARGSMSIRTEEVWLTTAAGYRVRAMVVEPDDREVRPALVLVPGRGKDSDTFVLGPYVVHADELAARGWRTVCFDPVGRGRSWGHDDFCGSEGQDSLRATLDFTRRKRTVAPERIGVLSFSMGLALAARTLAQHGERQGVRFLVDWEGPADRAAMLRTGALPPAARTALAADPEGFWARREPIAWIDQLPCPYVRVQGRKDHAMGPRGIDGALRLVTAAQRGTRAGLNTHPLGAPVDESTTGWAPDSAGGLHKVLLAHLTTLFADGGPVGQKGSL